MYSDIFGKEVPLLKNLTQEKLTALFVIRCSSIKEFMAKGRAKSELWGDTAKGLIMQMANEICYATNIQTNATKTIAKGVVLENDSIELVNRMYFENYTKNDLRLSNGIITGCPDIIDHGKRMIIDIKSSYSLDSFAKERFGKGTDYTAQLRGYLWLYDMDYGCTAHTLLNTPKELWKYGDTASMHNYDHIPAEDRVIIGNIVYRDIAWEQEVAERHAIGLSMFLEYVEVFRNNGRELPLPPIEQVVDDLEEIEDTQAA